MTEISNVQKRELQKSLLRASLHYLSIFLFSTAGRAISVKMFSQNEITCSSIDRLLNQVQLEVRQKALILQSSSETF